MIGIIIESFDRYRDLIERNHLNPKDFKSITRTEDIRGVSFEEVWETKGALFLNDIGFILQYLQTKGIKIIQKELK